VLGDQWKMMLEGDELNQDFVDTKKKLREEQNDILMKWKKEIENAATSLTQQKEKPIMVIEKVGESCTLKVNFDEKFLNLYKMSKTMKQLV
jgi:1-aminocyclopropane-1-carboxylate deaminase/D-cysteine desulfhydrase-like pyridoxal-dependent ACC family enzyme